MVEDKRTDSTMEVLLDELEDELEQQPAPANEIGNETDASLGAEASIPPPPPPPPPPPRVAPLSRPPALSGTTEPITEELEVDSVELQVTWPDRSTRAAKEIIADCEATLRQRPDDRIAARLHYEIGRLYEAPLGDLRRAAMHYQESLKRQPEHLPSLRGTCRVLLARRSYQAAAQLFEDEARLTPDPVDKASLLHIRGRLLEDVLGRKEEARDTYTSALELDRTSPVILRSLIARALEDQRFHDVERLLEQAANAITNDPRHRAALITERAHLVETRLGDRQRATELFETALRLDPSAPGAIGALKRLHHMQGRWRDLIRVLRIEAEQTEEPSVRAAALARVAQLHTERLGNRSEAVNALEEGMAVAKDDTLLATELAHLYELAGRWDALADTLQALARRLREPRERLTLLHRLGTLYEQRLHNTAAAVHWYEAALALDPAHTPTLQALAPLYEAEERWPELIRLHQGEAEHARDRQRRAAAHVRMAEIHEERLGDAETAIDCYAKALAIEPTYPAAFKGLSGLLAQTRRYRELVELHERAIEFAATTSEAIAHLLTIATVQEHLLGDPAQAAHAYQRVLELDGNHLQAIQALQRASERAGRYEEFVRALELEANLTEDEDRLVGLLHQAGEVRREHLGDRGGALTTFRRVLDLRHDYTPALRSLGRLLQELGRWEELLSVHERELDLMEKGPQALALLDAMAELCRERIGREEDAVELHRRALAIDPGHGPALRALTHHLTAREDWKGLTEILQAQLGTLTDPAARAQVGFAIGLLREERLNQPDLARAAYQQALAELPRHRPSLDALTRLRVREENWAALAEELGREAKATADRRLAIDALVRQGKLYAVELNDPRKAITCFEAVLDTAPNYVGAVLALEALYRRVGAWEQLAELHASEAAIFTDTSARLAALQAQAWLIDSRKLGGPIDLTRIWRSVLELAPTHTGALRGLERVALASGDLEQLIEVDRRWIELVDDAAVRASHWTRLGESLEALAREGSLDAFRHALSDDPESIAAARGFMRAAEQANDPALLAEAMRHLADITQTPAEKAALLVRSADVRVERLGDNDGAIADLERALEYDPDSRDAAAGLTRLLATEKQQRRLLEVLSRAATAAGPERSNALWLDVARLQAEAIQNVPQAIGTLRRVLRTSPNHVPALRQLAEHLVRQSEWDEAAETLARLVQLAPDETTLKAAHLDLAELWGTRLGDEERALVSLQAVLQMAPDNVQALTRLTDLHERQRRFDLAASAAQRLVEATEDSKERASALLRLARIERSRGNVAPAARALRQAVALEGPGSESAIECKALCDSPPDWSKYLEALQAHLQGVSDAAAGPTYLEIGRVLFDVLGRPDEALELLRQGAQRTSDAALRRELATRLRIAGHTEEASATLQTLVTEDTTRAEVWRDLVRTYTAAGRPSEARLASDPLLILEAASESDLALRQTNPPRPGMARPGSLGPVLEQLGTPPPEQRAAGELLRCLEGALPKLYPPDLESYGLSTRDKLTTRTGHPLKSLADELAAILDVPNYELFVHRTRARGMGTELGNPVMILVPAAVAELPRAQQVFLLARPLVHLARGFAAVDKLTPRELEVLLSSAARSVAPKHGTGLTSEEVFDAQAKRLHKALSRKQRKALEQAAAHYVEAGRLDFVRWARATRRTATRVAALLADDLPACVDVLRRTERELSPLSGASLIAQSDAVADLVTFWTSEAAMHLRRHAGLLDA